MYRFRSADKYYDSVLERAKANSWWRVGLRYFFFVLVFFIFISAALSFYWIWQDYSAAGLSGITWANFAGHALYRWHELQAGRLGIN